MMASLQRVFCNYISSVFRYTSVHCCDSCKCNSTALLLMSTQGPSLKLLPFFSAKPYASQFGKIVNFQLLRASQGENCILKLWVAKKHQVLAQHLASRIFDANFDAIPQLINSQHYQNDFLPHSKNKSFRIQGMK